MRFLQIAAIFLIISVSSGCGSHNDPDMHAKRFMGYLKEGKHLAVQDYLSDNMMQLATLMGGVTDDSLNPYYRTGKIVDYTLTLTEQTSSSARYRVVVSCADGKMYTDRLDLTRQAGKWRVSQF